MQGQRRGIFLSLLICLPCLASPSMAASEIKDLKGAVEKRDSGPLKSGTSSTALSGSTSSDALNTSAATSRNGRIILQGGAKDGAALRPSVKVTPTLNTGIGSFGAALGRGIGIPDYSSSRPAPNLSGMVPYYGSPNVSVPQGAIGRRTGIIPPISTYMLTPKSGITSYVPGYEVKSIPQQNGVINVPGSSSTFTTPAPVVRKGVTSYAPGYEVTNVLNTPAPPGGIKSFVSTFEGTVPAPARSGVTAWTAGYETNTIIKGASSLITDAYLQSRNTPNTVTNKTPGYQVAFSTPRNGVVCWSPGYEITVETPGLVKQTLGGMWTSPAHSIVAALRATPGKLPVPDNKICVQMLEPPMVAKAKMLPGIMATTTSPNLEDWYHRVARVIYENWQQVEVGPGIAKVRVSVTRNREMSGVLVDFTPAEGVERNVDAETAFREAAVRAVNRVYVFEIPDFPTTVQQNEITFDVTMKRTVDGQAGFNVASGSEANKTAPQPPEIKAAAK